MDKTWLQVALVIIVNFSLIYWYRLEQFKDVEWTMDQLEKLADLIDALNKKIIKLEDKENG